MSKKMERLKEQYERIEIPVELDEVVEQALKPKKRSHLLRNSVMGGVAAAVLFMAGLNASPVFAQSLAEVPLLGSIAKVLTFKEYRVADGTMEANIKVPAIENTGNEALEETLNQKYLEEGKKLYDEFIAEMELLEQNGGGHMGLDSGYVIKTDNDQILSIGRYVVNTAASSSTTFKYDTIDKQQQLLITLPSLFKNDGYIGVISDNIQKQMKEQMASDPDLVYWVKGAGEDDVMVGRFETIAEDQNFYINEQGKLVIAFDKYEVAPGYMGTVEFVVPTDVIDGLLVDGQDVIK
ncbi:anti-sigma factor [Ammoniphilus oxalaticus]|uniref:Anti-sigma factor n=1 Tax=Ammoniphilus oxalaticus TaxID=66863 RepID=A0A419SGQ8_9BACL|nr:RsiV family protein [Ammoniphilus oxalaticus]RKD22991.1 anti-sigma factor [Ammoniphilus oxalaticus]